MHAAFAADGKFNHLVKKQTFLTYDQASLRKRPGLVRGFASLNQVEFVYLWTNQDMKIKEQSYDAWPTCTTKGNVIGPVAMPSLTESWATTFKTRNEFTERVGDPWEELRKSKQTACEVTTATTRKSVSGHCHLV